MMQTPICPLSARRYPLSSSTFLYPCHSFLSTGDGRQLAESTTTCILDELINAYPQRLDLFRTRGIRDEYSASVKDFTHALKEARALRKARSFHRNGSYTAQSKGTATREKRIARKSRMGKCLPMGQVMPMGAVIPQRPKPLKRSTYLFFPTLQSPSNLSYSFSALQPIFRMPSSWSTRGS